MASQKVKHELLYDSAIPLLDKYPKELKRGTRLLSCMLMFTAAIFQPKMETTQVEYTHTHTHLRAYSAIKKEQNSNICYNTNELRKHYAKLNNSDTKGQGLYDFTYLKYQEQANSQIIQKVD